VKTPLSRWDGDALLLNVYAQPGASRDEIGAAEPRGLRVRIQAPPVGGAANSRLIAILAEAFGVAKGNVTVKRGANSRSKLVRIEAPQRIPPQLRGKAQ